ncbi:MAG: hypothetical protein AB1798_11000 [Spirochaetota bacterium]
MDCSSCHHAHKPFENNCALCHSWNFGDRFK